MMIMLRFLLDSVEELNEYVRGFIESEINKIS